VNRRFRLSFALIALLAMMWAQLAPAVIAAARPDLHRLAGEICSVDSGARAERLSPDLPAPDESRHVLAHCAWCAASGQPPLLLPPEKLSVLSLGLPAHVPLASLAAAPALPWRWPAASARAPPVFS